jgi:hypothetical protein
MHALILAAMASGFGDGSYRLSAVVADQQAEHPGPLLNTKDSFRRSTVAMELHAFGFFDQSRYGTWIGGELLHRIGLRGREPGYVDTTQRPKFFTSTEAALDLSPFDRDNGVVRGRLTFGGGIGVDLDTGRWFPGWGRAYPIVLIRSQIWIGSFCVSTGYRWIPNTTNAATLTEHRAELGVAYARFHLGGRYAFTRIREGEERYTFYDRELFAGYAF